MPTLLLALLGIGTLAFGGVYPWAYAPLFAAAALIGTVGLVRHGVVPELRPVAWSLLALWILAAFQLLPLPPAIVDTLSPSTAAVATSYRVGGSDAGWLPLSIDPARTQVSVAALGALALFLLGTPPLVGAQGLRRFARALAMFAVPLALFAVYTREHNNGLVYGFWQPLDGGGADQAGPFVNRNHFGGWLVMSVSLMMGWLLGRLERTVAVPQHRNRGPVSAEDLGAMLLMAGAVVLCTISLFWIVSRSAIVSFGVAMALLAGLALRRRRLGSAARAVVLVTFGAVVLAGVSWRGADVLIGWFLDERSLLSRLDAWRDGWDVVRAFPWLGTGLNTYSPAMLFYQTRNPGFHMAQAHNDYLQLLAEGGLVVSGAAAVTFGLIARAIVRTLRAARIEAQGYWVRAGAGAGLAAIACQEAVEFSLQIPANAFLCCTLVTLAVTPVRAGAPRAAISRDTITLPRESAVAAVS